MDLTKLKKDLNVEEACKKLPYVDTKGKISIGVGRNLTDRGLSDDEIDYLLSNDITIAVTELDKQFHWWRSMSDARQNVLIDMCFNMGITKLLGFKKALAAMAKQDFEQAATEMLDSVWSKDVHGRADKLAQMMKSGEF